VAKKQIDDKIYAQFKYDVRLLQAEYLFTDQAIADKLSLDPANFSSYMSDNPQSKRPGKRIINRFYKSFGDDLKKIRKQQQADGPRVLFTENTEDYQGDPIPLLKQQAEDIQDIKTRLSGLEDGIKIIRALLEGKEKP